MRLGPDFLARQLLCVCALFGALEANARAQISEPVAPPASVTLTLVGNPADAAALETRVVSWFRAQGTLTRSSHLSTLDPRAILVAAHEPGVRIWIVLEPPASVRLFFAVEGRGPAPPRYLVRDVPLDGGLDELGLEQVAQVVDLSAMALWAGNVASSRQEVERELGLATPAPPAQPEPVAPSTPRAAANGVDRSQRAALVVGFEYAARATGPEGIAHGPGALFGLSWRRNSVEYGTRWHAQLLLPREVTRSSITLKLRGAAFGLGASFAQRTSERVWATGELGAGLDVIEYGSVSLGDASLQPVPARVEARPLSYASVGLRAQIGFVNISAAAVLAVQLLHTHYDIADGDRHSELFSPWLAQPGLAASATW